MSLVVKRVLIFVLLVGIASFSACNPEVQPNNEEQMRLRAKSNRVVAVSYPLKYIAGRLLDGTNIEVSFPGAEADAPGIWQPPEDVIAKMQTADMVVTNGPGVTYAQWLIRVTLAEKKTCVSASELPLNHFISVSDHKIVHRHGPEGEHSHPYMVPYSWLDPATFALQANKIAEDLTNVYTEHEQKISENLQSLTADLNQLSEKLSDVSSALNNDATNNDATLLTANPNLKFLTRAAEITDVHLLWLEEVPENPSEAITSRLQDWTALNSEGERREAPTIHTIDGAMVLLWPSSLKSPPEIEGVRIVEIDLLDHQTDGRDYLSAMTENIERLAGAFEQ